MSRLRSPTAHWYGVARRGISGQLEYRHYDVFTVLDKPAEINPDGLALSFGYDREGIVKPEMTHKPR
ncbi:hypothetical protein, partial [Cupriavidus sp. SK-3]|uniref:hypothetical protein n=1 Tax=Cupriavidus sp. SK-3 TaxID=1470558 RepID=UPI0012679759